MAYIMGTNLWTSLIASRYVDVYKLFSEKNIKLFLRDALRGRHQGRKASFLAFSITFKFFTMCMYYFDLNMNIYINMKSFTLYTLDVNM